MNDIGVKTDCFGYSEEKNDCKALRELYCKREKCKFYKTKAQHVEELKARGEYCG